MEREENPPKRIRLVKARSYTVLNATICRSVNSKNFVSGKFRSLSQFVLKSRESLHLIPRWFFDGDGTQSRRVDFIFAILRKIRKIEITSHSSKSPSTRIIPRAHRFPRTERFRVRKIPEVPSVPQEVAETLSISGR